MSEMWNLLYAKLKEGGESLARDLNVVGKVFAMLLTPGILELV